MEGHPEQYLELKCVRDHSFGKCNIVCVCVWGGGLVMEGHPEQYLELKCVRDHSFGKCNIVCVWGGGTGYGRAP